MAGGTALPHPTGPCLNAPASHSAVWIGSILNQHPDGFGMSPARGLGEGGVAIGVCAVHDVEAMLEAHSLPLLVSPHPILGVQVGHLEKEDSL